MTDFCGIPLASLRENSITELNLEGKGIGVPGAIVLSKLLPFAAALTLLKCAAAPSRACQAPMNTFPLPRRLANNMIGGYYDDEGDFVSTTEGITALCEGLKGSAVTSLT